MADTFFVSLIEVNRISFDTIMYDLCHLLPPPPRLPRVVARTVRMLTDSPLQIIRRPDVHIVISALEHICIGEVHPE